MDRSVTKNFRLPRYVCFACKTIYIYIALARGSKNIALQETRRSFRIPWYGVTHPPLSGGHERVDTHSCPPAVAASPSYTLYGYRSSGLLPRRKDGFCERVTRGSPERTRLCLDLINFSYFRVSAFDKFFARIF